MVAGTHQASVPGTEKFRDGEANARDGFIKSAVVKRSITVGRHKTSVSLEDAFWNALCNIAREKGIPLSQLLEGIDTSRRYANLSSAVRLFVLEHYHARQPGE